MAGKMAGAHSNKAKEAFLRIRPIMVRGALSKNPVDIKAAHTFAKMWFVVYDRKHSYRGRGLREEFRLTDGNACIARMLDRMLKITQGG